MRKINTAYIRQLIAQGYTDDEIEDAVHEAECAEIEERERFGDDHEDTRTTAEKEMCDRLDMGRNDAGEWLGFC